MNNKGRLYSTALASAALVFAFLILISAAASAAQVTKIGSGSNPAVYGNRVVWTNAGVIHLYDLNARTDTTVSSSKASYPVIYGNKLVWHDESSGTPRLAVYDIPKGAMTYITQDVDPYSRPSIYGNRIVWSANYNESNYDYNIYMRDISTSTQTKIGTGSRPDIYDAKVVYHSDSENPEVDMNIRMYDLNTKKKITVNSSGDPEDPHIWGTKIIWADLYNLLGYIAMYDTSTGKTIDVTHEADVDTNGNQYGASTGTHIAIQGDKIVYNKVSTDPEGAAGVYMYSIASGKSTLLYNYPPGTYTTPDVYDNIVVWGFDTNYSSGNSNTDIYLCDLAAPSEKPTATFTADVTSGVAPLKVQFTSEITGNPADYYWVFEPSTNSDWNSHHAETAVHTFTQPGVYTVNLTVSNDAGSYTATREGYITVTDASGSTGNIPMASFSANVTSGTAPLVVLFTDTSTGFAPASWLWNFGDGTTSNHAMNAIHTFTNPGNYEISLIMESATGNATVIKANYITVTDPEIKDPNAPVADFNSNVTEGYAPLTVQFNDLSQKATSRIWDFNGDGQPDSNDINPIYVYTNAGTYTVNLTVSNENGTASKTAAINVLTRGSSGGGSSGSSHSSGGGAGGSPEPAKNVEVKELSQAFIASGKPVQFDFPKNATCVVYISFDAKKTFGKTTTIAEQLKGKSTLVSELNAGEVYKYFNVWVGTGGFATSKNIENPVVRFKVEKSWIQDKMIDPASITLNRYSDKKWEQLPVSLSGEDDKFLYFTAKTPEFSSFVITGKEKNIYEETVAQKQPGSDNGTINKNNTANKEPQNEQKEIPNTSGFETVCGVAGLLAVFLYKRK